MDATIQSPEPQLVVFLLEGQRYALPLPAVERVLPMVAVSPLPEAPAVALGVINLQGRVIPVPDIGRRFGLPPRHYGLTAHLLAHAFWANGQPRGAHQGSRASLCQMAEANRFQQMGHAPRVSRRGA